MIKNQVERDIRKSVASLQNSQQWPDFEMPELYVELVSKPDECAYQTNFSMKLAPLLKKHALEVAADIKSQLPDTYSDVDIVQHGTLKVILSQDQLEQAAQDVIEQGADYGSLTDGAGQSVLVECFSLIPSHPLNLADARAAYAADIMARVYSELGYSVTRAALLHDREDEIERLGESVARRYLQRIGINVPFDDHLIDADYVNELASKIELKDMTLENIQKIEWLKQHIADLATDMMRTKMDKTLKSDMLLKINEWGVESKIIEQVTAADMLKHLSENNQMYERGGSTYVRTAQLGDVRDRPILDRDNEPTDQYAELVLYYDRIIARKYDRILLSLPWTRQDRAWFARQLPKLFGDTGPVLTMVSGPMQIVADGQPIRMKNTNLDEIYVHDVIQTYGADIIRWFMIKHPNEEEADFDVQRMNQEIGDELKSMKSERKELRALLSSADTAGQVYESYPDTFQLPVERRLLRLLLLFPELLQAIGKRHQTGLLYDFLQELRTTAMTFAKQCPLVEDKQVIVYRYLLVQGALLVLSRVQKLYAINSQKK